MHGQQNDKYTEMHGQQNFKKSVETCSLYAPINVCCADVYFVNLLYTSLEHFGMPSLKLQVKFYFTVILLHLFTV